MATDGLFDNVSTEQILKELARLEVGTIENAAFMCVV